MSSLFSFSYPVRNIFFNSHWKLPTSVSDKFQNIYRAQHTCPPIQIKWTWSFLVKGLPLQELRWERGTCQTESLICDDNSLKFGELIQEWSCHDHMAAYFRKSSQDRQFWVFCFLHSLYLISSLPKPSYPEEAVQTCSQILITQNEKKHRKMKHKSLYSLYL